MTVASAGTVQTTRNYGRRIRENLSIFVSRRERVIAALNGTPLMVAAHSEFLRNDDVEHAYRPDSNLYYLTGFEEPESILLILPGRNPQTVLFVRNKNVERETWDGFRFGTELAKSEFGVDAVFPIDDFAKQAVPLLKDFDEIYFRMFKNEWADQVFKKLLKDLKMTYGRSGYGLLTVKDADTFLGEFRLRKDNFDLLNLRKACEISAKAHTVAMKNSRPGINEKQIEGLIISEFYKHGALREGYGAIVAAGNNATTLHYRFNDQVCKDGDLLLIDAGAEYNYFTGDITRTFPVNGRFTGPQKKVYDAVLKVQKQVIEAIKPGLFFKDLQEMGVDLLTEAMFELGLLTGQKQDVIKSLEYKKYYPHGIGHWLGMDVHDAGLYMKKGQPQPIEVGMCFTVEPGLYIPADDKSAPAELRGIGVRIEDNILVTENGCDVLTSLAPKEVEEIEQLMTRSALSSQITL
jgi:Xaa-Pro aminopeptidase